MFKKIPSKERIAQKVDISDIIDGGEIPQSSAAENGVSKIENQNKSKGKSADELTKQFLDELEFSKADKEKKTIENKDVVNKNRKRKKKKISMLAIILIAIVMILVIVGLSATILVQSASTVKLQKGSEAVNPLTGEIVTAPLPARPIIVSNDNAEGARPQSGITKADIVYEFPAEGYIPRLQPIFYSQFPERVAAVRSVRNYFIDLAREFKAIHVGYGGSPQAKEYLATGVIPYVNAVVGDDIFWRDMEARGDGIHNVYVNLNEAYAMNKTEDWQAPQIVRSYPRYPIELSEEKKAEQDEYLAAFPAATNITLAYVSEDIEYKYDPETELYTRYVDGEVAVDFEDQTPVTTSNVIIQLVSIGMLDSKRLDIDMTAGGACMVFTKGKAFIGEWSRDNLEAPTVFYMTKTDEGGNAYKEEIKLGVGKTWVQVIDKDQNDVVYQ